MPSLISLTHRQTGTTFTVAVNTIGLFEPAYEGTISYTRLTLILPGTGISENHCEVAEDYDEVFRRIQAAQLPLF